MNRKEKKNLPLQMQWIVNSEPIQFQNQVVPKLSFEILSCSIAHEMLGPEEVTNIPRNHWHETVTPFQQFFLPLRWLVLQAWQPLRGRRGPCSPPAGDPAKLPTATCRMSLQTEVVRSSCLGKGAEAEARLPSYSAMMGAGLKLTFFHLPDSLLYVNFCNKLPFLPMCY